MAEGADSPPPLPPFFKTLLQLFARWAQVVYMSSQLNWNAIIGDLGPALYRYFCASFNKTAADECVQITVTRLYEKVREGKFDPERGNLRMYAFGIAHYVRLEGLNLRDDHDEWTDRSPMETLDHSETLESDAQIKRLRKAIRQLSEIQQQVLALYLDQELTNEQIGQILQIPPNTVKSHIHRAKEALLIILNPTKEAH